MQNLTSVDGQFYITDNILLSNLTPLENLTEISGVMNIINNISLNSLSGLENIDPYSITDLSVYNNMQLAVCDIQSICEYLVDPGGSVDIQNNASGCNNVEEIEETCEDNCLPEGIEFETQAQIDNFQANYPGCTEIEGDVTIGKFMNSSNITNLDGLNVLTSIGGYLDIRLNDNLNNLNGLENLTSTGGFLSVFNNDALSDLSGLNQITHVEGHLYITYSDGLTSLTGLENLSSIGGNLEIRINDALNSLSGLNNLSTIDGALEIRANFALHDLSELSGVNSIGDHIWIGGNTVLESLTGLEGINTVEGYLLIDYNYELTELSALENLISVGDYLELRDNYMLPNLEGLDNLASVGGSIEMRNNDALENLDALEGLTSICGEFRISENDLLTSLTGLQNIEAASISDLYIHDNNILSFCDIESVCGYLAAPNGAIYITNNATGCADQEEVEEACFSDIIELNSQHIFSISPNPVSSLINIQYTIANAGYVMFNLFEISGTKIKQLKNKICAPGAYEFEIDLSELPGGIYFITYKTNLSTKTKKIIKL